MDRRPRRFDWATLLLLCGIGVSLGADPDPLTFRGQLEDYDNGTPVEGATVRVRLASLHPDVYVEPVLYPDIERRSDAEGRFEFTIPEDRAADPNLHVFLEIDHPGYALHNDTGAKLSAIQRLCRLGDNPFAKIQLLPALDNVATVVSPEGDRLPGVKGWVWTPSAVWDVSGSTGMAFYHRSLFEVVSDENGEIRFKSAAVGSYSLFVRTAKFIPARVSPDRVGAIGPIRLTDGIRLGGRVLDDEGKPVGGHWVVARRVRRVVTLERQDPPDPYSYLCGPNYPTAPTALTGEDGRFAFGPLPPGKYTVLPVDQLYGVRHRSLTEYLRSHAHSRRTGLVFRPREIELAAGAAAPELEFRAAESVVVEVKCVDSKDRPKPGEVVSLFGGRTSGRRSAWATTAVSDEQGVARLRVPRGMSNVYFPTSRFSIEPDASLGTVERDVRGLVARYITRAVALVELRAKNDDVDYELTASAGPNRWLIFQKQTDGRYRCFVEPGDHTLRVQVSVEKPPDGRVSQELNVGSFTLAEGEVGTWRLEFKVGANENGSLRLQAPGGLRPVKR